MLFVVSGNGEIAIRNSVTVMKPDSDILVPKSMNIFYFFLIM